MQANAASDAASNQGPTSPVSATATRDADAPTVTIAGVPEHITSNAPLTVTFTFNEDVTGFDVTDTNDVTVTNAAIVSTGTDTATTYQATITPDGNGDVTVTVKANAAADTIGNTGPAADVSETAKYDAAAPTVEVELVPTVFNAAGDEITATFTFDEAVTGFALDDITVTGGNKPAALTTGEDGDREYTAVFTTSGSSGDLTVEVAANAVTDLASNQGPTSPVSATATRDADAPTVTIAGVPEHITSNAPLTVTFTFNEDVTGFDVTDTNDVTVTNAAIVKTGTDTATTYQATVTPDGNGDVTVTVKANAAADTIGNTGPAAGVSKTAEYDATAPTVEVELVPTVFNAAGDEITATFTFDEAVTGFALDDITVTGGTAPAALATGADGDSEYTAVFTTSGGSGDLTVEVAANAVTDLASNQGPANPVSATATRDADAPTVAIAGVPAYINDTTAFDVTFTFDEDVTGFDVTDTNDVTVTNAAITGTGTDTATTYQATVNPDGEGDVTITVKPEAVNRPPWPQAPTATASTPRYSPPAGVPAT